MIKKITSLMNHYIIAFQILILSFLIINSNMHLPCLPEIQQAYSTSEQLVQVAFIINPFIAIFISLPCGVSADLYGRKIVLLSSLSLFILGTLLIIQAQTLHLFFLGRFLQSLGDGGTALVSGIIIGDYYRGRAYAKIQAILSIALALAWAGAPLLGEQLFTAFGWRGNFAFIFIIFFFMIFSLSFWQERKEPQRKKKGLFKTLVETKKTMVSMFNPSFFILSLAQALPLAVFTAFEFMMPFIYKETYSYSVKGNSAALFIFIAINVAGSLLYRFLITYANLKKLLRLGTYIFFIYFILGIFYFNLTSSPQELTVYIIFSLLSFSLPFIIISSSTKIVDSNPEHLGIALSLLTILRNTGTTGIPLFSCMFSANTFDSFFNTTLIFTVLALVFLFKSIKCF